MTAMEHFQSSDTLQITSLGFQLQAIGQDQSGSVPPFCKTKTPGLPLEITLAATDIGLPVPGLNIPFTGTPNGEQTQITWTVDEQIDLTVPVRGLPVRFYPRLHGQITTSVDDAMPRLLTACDGMSQRLFRSSLTTVGSANELFVDSSLGQIHAHDIALTALAGEIAPPLFFRVGVACSGWLEDGCGMKFQAPNTDVMFSALVQSLVFSGTLVATNFEWTCLSGPAVISGSHTNQSVSLHIEDVGIVTMKVHVEVITDVEASHVDRVFSFAVFDDESARLLRSLCHLRQQFAPRLNRVVRGVGPGFTAGGVNFVDPLWDPTPDLAAAAHALVPEFSLLDLARLQSSTEHLGHVAGAITKGLSEVLSKKGFASAFVGQASGPKKIEKPNK